MVLSKKTQYIVVNLLNTKNSILELPIMGVLENGAVENIYEDSLRGMRDARNGCQGD